MALLRIAGKLSGYKFTEAENKMMRDQKLHAFLCSKTEFLTEQWYESLDKTKDGVYGSTDPETIQQVKAQNHAFHVQFCGMFEKDDTECIEEFQDWIKAIAKDEAHLTTPLEEIIEEFFRTQQQYLELIEEYAEANLDELSIKQIIAWNRGVVETINHIILEYTLQHSLATKNRLNAQREMIVEMSAPVISLAYDIGFLPLVGEIDTYRAHIIFEKALSQCAEQRLNKLFIDLSGVPIIDTMVAHQIFQLIDGLNLIGVETALSGISPDIAQTAVQLGLNFNNVEIHNTLAQAMRLNKLNII